MAPTFPQFFGRRSDAGGDAGILGASDQFLLFTSDRAYPNLVAQGREIVCSPSCSDRVARNASCDSRRFHLIERSGEFVLARTVPARSLQTVQRSGGCNSVPERYCSTCSRPTVSRAAVERVSKVHTQARRPTMRAQHCPAASLAGTKNGGSIGRPHLTRDVYCNKGHSAWWRVVESKCWWSPSSSIDETNRSLGGLKAVLCSLETAKCRVTTTGQASPVSGRHRIEVDDRRSASSDVCGLTVTACVPAAANGRNPSRACLTGGFSRPATPLRTMAGEQPSSPSLQRSTRG